MSKRIFFCTMLIACCILLFSACGRRGDPVLIAPTPEVAVGNEDAGKKPEEAVKEQEKDGGDAVQEVRPPAPSDLRGLFTQTSIILTWNEVPGKNIRYRIYRSSGDGYAPAGETATPAFTDKNVEPEREYHYRISAVGTSEGPPSEEIIIVTEIQ